MEEMSAWEAIREAVKQFNGTRQSCEVCGLEGIVGEDLKDRGVVTDPLGEIINGKYHATIGVDFHCIDRKACLARAKSSE